MKKNRKVGRPANKPSDLIVLDQAVNIIKEELLRRYNNPELVKRCSYTKQTLYNKIHYGHLQSWREGRYVLVSQAEILKLVA